MSLPSVGKPSITTTKTDNPETKRLSLQDQIDDLDTLAPRKSIPNDQGVSLKSPSLTSSQNGARKNSYPENFDIQSQPKQPLPSPSSQIHARRNSPQTNALQPQLSSHPSQIEARKNSPQNLNLQPGLKSGSFQIQTINTQQQQQPRLSQSAQIHRAPKPPIHEESGHMEVKDDTRTYGMPPGGLPAYTEESSKLLVYEWKGTKGRELESRLPPTKQKADRHDEVHLDNLPNSTADEAWLFLDAIPVKEKRVKVKPNPFNVENLESEPLEKGDSLDSIKSIEPNNNKPSEPDNDKDNQSLSKYVSKIPEDSKKEQEVKEVVESLMSIVFSGNPAGGERRKPVKEKKPPPPKPKPKPEPPKKIQPKKVKQPKPQKQHQYNVQAMPQNDFLHFNQTIPTQEYALQPQQPQQPQQQQQQYNQQMQIQPQVATQQQIGILPPRTTAFQAPFVPLRGINQGYPPNGSDPNIEEDDDGLKFAFNPRADCATEVTFTVEPRKRPMWQTMMNCGFTPVIYCSVPPCCLPGNAAPGAPNCCGKQESSSEESSSGSSEEESSDEDQGAAKNAGRGQGRPSLKPLIVESRVVIDYNASEDQPRRNRQSIASRKLSVKSNRSERARSVYAQSEKGDSLSFGSSSD